MSYNSLFGLGTHSPDADLKGYWKLQDNAASTVVVDSSGNSSNGTSQTNTSTKTLSGPNSWLTAALDFNGSSDYITTPVTGLAGSFSVMLFLSRDTADTTRQMIVAKNSDPHNSGDWFLFLYNQSGHEVGVASYDGSSFALSSSATAPTSGWKHLAAVRGSGSVEAILDGTSLGSVSSSPTATSTDAIWLGARQYSGFQDHFNGALAGVAIFSRKLTSGEVAEHRLGPEPLNTVAPTISGTTTLSATTGTWNSQSNGTLTYSYQWTKDGSDIGGATSSTYNTSGVSGVYRCRVRASNDGGYDSAQDTVSSNSITVSGGATYTLTSDNASFALTGQDVALTASRQLTADQATYSESGQDANVLARRLLTSDNGSYTASGQDATFTATGSLVGDVGTFALSGQDVNLVRGRALTADFGAFVSTGQDASLTRSRVVAADQSAFTLSGQDATLTKTGQASLAADYVTFSALGQDATLTYSNAPNVPYLELDFQSNNAAIGTLTALSATGSLVALQATGTLVVTDTET